MRLDKTIFCPEGGGQVGDIGSLGNSKVVDTQIKNCEIIHILEEEPTFIEGEEVMGLIDWERRYKIMKLHSAAHITEYFLFSKLGILERTGSRVDENKDRGDYVYDGRLSSEQLILVEKDSNKFLEKGHKITIEKDPMNPNIRIWRCGPIEMQCGGTHVKNTIEIGQIKLKRKNPGRGVERVETSLRS